VLEITSVLRSAFPNDNFGVTFDEIASLPNDAPLSKEEGQLEGSISFCINLGGVQTATAMRAKVTEYVRALEVSKVEYFQITFKSGTNPWIKRSITVSGNQLSNVYDLPIRYVRASYPTDFNNFLEYVASQS